MSDRPYHHGNLRTELLQGAQTVLRDRGADALSLRELARAAGVSHAAPRRHFADRQALLDALALEGFAQLGAILRAAIADGPDDFAGQLRTTAHAYIAFASRDAELLELMFSSKHGEHAEEIERAAQGAFSVMLSLIMRGQDEGVLPAGDPERVGMVHLATIQGIATLLAGGMVVADQLEWLVEDAVAQMLAAKRVLV
jgi:AcrR family transcriptional regulator